MSDDDLYEGATVQGEERSLPELGSQLQKGETECAKLTKAILKTNKKVAPTRMLQSQ